MLSLLRKDKKLAYGTGFYILGVLLAFLIVALIGMFVTNNPFYVINIYTKNYQTFNMTPAFMNYINDLFNPAMWKSFDGLAFGYFGYVFLGTALYLTCSKFKKGAIVGYWFLFSLLYLGLGSQSINRYNPVIYVGPRYALIFVPAMVLIIGIGMAKLVDEVKRRKMATKLLVYVPVAVVVILLVVSSVKNIIYINYSQLYATEPLLQFGQYLNTLPSNSTIFGPSDIPWNSYINQSRHVVILGYSFDENTCKNVTSQFKLTSGSFFVGNVTDYVSCALQPVYTPTEVYRLRNYTLFKNWGVNFYSYKIYEYDPSSNAIT